MKVGIGVGGLLYNIFSVGCSGISKVVGGFAFLFLFLGGGSANIAGSTGVSSVRVGSCSRGEEGVFSICLDSVSKQISASKYGWRGLARSSSVWCSEVTQGFGNGGVFKFSST